MKLEDEVKRRRTVAIISHPDAGKTTLTEKFLLYGGAVQEAGAVRARKNQRSATSDWMEMERKRGISVTSTVLQFPYGEYMMNLLDTPGHQDFSEDTYRILTAVDSVIMVIDAAKGIETQTLKLFEVCRKRMIPIFTFINKMDRPTREPLDLLDEIEKVLNIGVYPINWPLGTGFDFKGVFDRLAGQVHLFERTIGGAYKAPVAVGQISDPFVEETLEPEAYAQVVEELEMLDIAGESFDHSQVLSGAITPVFFGSAMNNFGVQLLLDNIFKYAPPPGPYPSSLGEVSPTREDFSGFVFKIQANMDPKHRDRIAFVRICTGKYSKNLSVYHSRTGRKVKLSNAHALFGQERETVEEAYAGDIVGLISSDRFGIGDTLSETSGLTYAGIPYFAPEHFVFLNNPNPSNYKRYRDGLDQLLQEGVIQGFELNTHSQNNYVLGAVGPLQFDVVQYRLENEYKAETEKVPANWSVLRWVDPEVDPNRLDRSILPVGAISGKDRDGHAVILFSNEWSLRLFQDKQPEIKLADTPFRAGLVGQSH
ncbi:peptide chain release factor 3 [bacterium (Candidatus Blackallbacteria) CG17_big_fil_post_rev_8_21_14_2_50_48_46]|uniref:Peptide chain release factor 3 n=1 Tax=bacterium (Candidatus Blackallbacteria) CG17_big_fil_post_rev_8_21_14_2_50_48_46 TaxID=2014261 RepID=A0A2M7G0N2_9BACT|nr:MAG: peptide chain release factor 3 [bacterium (Candidatus Blackallbacteria) CG18_big_fil_WC_8_21_14_2_50_49_26]PIW15239.1 MAG: peptide chain release factor 3 [bacterium (Candidatus Blackallbacteria) CG17_big_fil_post_rev_8_21_14_2_50_48_46]PIW45253.1 MAG: peptide chain release factor 3 [bacterium (Candidatus Blackallbacteria) CG13_big_fil_rev_8_21_14_2_50_49_14]